MVCLLYGIPLLLTHVDISIQDSPDFYKRTLPPSAPAIAATAARITHRNVLFAVRCNASNSTITCFKKAWKELLRYLDVNVHHCISMTLNLPRKVGEVERAEILTGGKSYLRRAIA
ncbi:hypothetical protein R3P38DRAFT_2793884 [Favolaschia claudopus]|uniref:Uncharacterized protein n=1 Tax=Favolaschia claudopus TaxID=2862362 RepID=A0AAW0ABS9_9AGAR